MEERSTLGSAGGDAALVAALRAGDEEAFRLLVERHYDTMLRVARAHVATRETAEDVVQESLLGVINGIDRFEGRSSLRTWLLHIVANRAKTQGQRDARTEAFSPLADELGGDLPTFAADRFFGTGRWAGYWQNPPSAREHPEASVLADEAIDKILAAVEALPPGQRAVMTLRDLDGFSAAEVCELLDLTETNQRVLLHRARTRVRGALERYLDDRSGAW